MLDYGHLVKQQTMIQAWNNFVIRSPRARYCCNFKYNHGWWWLYSVNKRSVDTEGRAKRHFNVITWKADASHGLSESLDCKIWDAHEWFTLYGMTIHYVEFMIRDWHESQFAINLLRTNTNHQNEDHGILGDLDTSDVGSLDSMHHRIPTVTLLIFCPVLQVQACWHLFNREFYTHT